MDVNFFKTLCENTLPELGFKKEYDFYWSKEDGNNTIAVWVDEIEICFEYQYWSVSNLVHFELDECPVETLSEMDDVKQVEFSSIEEFRNFNPELTDEELVEEIINSL